MNSKKLLAIEMQLSNMEHARIPCEYIGVLQTSGMKKVNDDTATPAYWAEKLAVSVNKNLGDYTRWYFDGEPTGQRIIDALRDYRRINRVDLIYEDERNRIHIEWYGEVLYVENGVDIYDPKYQNHNEYQRSKTNKHGDLFIEIGKKAELDSIFPDEIINANDYTVGSLVENMKF